MRGTSGCSARTPGHTSWSEMSSAPSREPESGGTTVLSSSVHSATHTGPGGVSSPALSRRSRSESGVELLAGRGARRGAERARERREVGAVVRRGEGDRAAYVRPAAEVGDVDADHDAARGVADQVHRRRPGLVRAPRRRRRRGARPAGAGPGSRSRSASRCERLGPRRSGRRPAPGARRSSRRTPGRAARVPAGPGPPARQAGPGVRRPPRRPRPPRPAPAPPRPAPAGAARGRASRARDQCASGPVTTS